MKKIFVFLNLVFCASLYSQEKKELFPIQVKADNIEYFTEKNLISAWGNVIITYKGMKLRCKKARINTKTKEAILEGNVIIEPESGKVIKCEKIIYNLDKKVGRSVDSRIESPPFYGFSKVSKELSEKHFVAQKAWISTCDLEKPHWKLSAKRIDIYPEDKIIAKSVVMKILDVPVFYFPVYVQSLKEKTFRLGVLPGRNKEWGFYLLTYYRYYLSEGLKGKLRLDWREKWGLAPGLDADLNLKDKGNVSLKLYYTEEEKRPGGFPRYRADLFSKIDLSKDIYLITEFHKFKDEDFLKDYFYREYERNPSPESYFYLNKSFKNSSMGIEVKKRFNRFFTVTELLPKFWFKIYNFSFKHFYYDSEFELTNFNKKYASSIQRLDCVRTFFSQKVSFPRQFKGITFSPYIGNDFAFYSKTKDTTDTTRGNFKGGVSLSTGFFRIYEFSQISFRHIIEPKLSFDFVSRPTFEKERLFIFDAKDKIDYVKKITFSLENFLEKKEKEDSLIEKFLELETEVDYFLDSYQGKGFQEIREKLELDIAKKIELKNRFTYSFKKNHLKSSSSDVSFLFSKKFKVEVGHYFSHKNSDSLITQMNFIPNHKWQFWYYQRYDFRNQEFALHQFKIRRDLHCWFCDIILTRDRDKNWGFYIAFRLKAFPNIGFNFETTYYGPRGTRYEG